MIKKRVLYISVFFRCVKARACFVCKVPMSVYLCVRVELAQGVEQIEQRGFLLGCAGVLRCLAVAVQTAHIDDADAVEVVRLTVGSLDVNTAAKMHVPVPVNNVVIAYVAPALCLVPGTNFINCEVKALHRCCAMDNDFVYSPFGFFEPRRDEFGKCGRSDNAVRRESILHLEDDDRLFGVLAVDAVLHDFQACTAKGFLYLANHLATAAYFV